MEAEGAGLFHPAVEPGAELPPGALIGWLLEAGEATARRRCPARRGRDRGARRERDAGRPQPTGRQPPQARTGRLFSSPNARRVARDRGIDVALLTGTGPGGRIITADVLDARRRAHRQRRPGSGRSRRWSGGTPPRPG